MTNQTILSIKKKAEAFPYPLFTVHPKESSKVYIKHFNCDEGSTVLFGGLVSSFEPNEADFISEARSDVLALIDEVEKLKKALWEARDALVRCENMMVHPPHQVSQSIDTIDRIMEDYNEVRNAE